MNRFIVFGIAAGLSLTAPVVAFAQQTPAPAAAPEQPAGASAQSGGEITENYGTVIEAIEGLSSTDVATLTDTDQLSIVLLSSLEGDEDHDGAAVDAAITANEAAITEFRAAVAANSGLVTKLQESDLTPDNALAIAKNADGSWRLYVDDRDK